MKVIVKHQNGKSYNEISYDAVGHKTGILYPNRNKMVYEYGKGYRVDKADGVLVMDDGSERIITKNRVLTRDGVGNIKEKQVNTGVQYYGYDSLYRLTGYSGEAVDDITYEYDYAGNRVSMLEEGETEVRYTIGNNNKTLSIVDLKNISYERGNMTVKGGDVYEYDYKNRMTRAVVPGAQISYLYDSSDRKIRRVKNNKATYYFYNGNKLLCEKYSGNRLSKIYTNDNEGVLGMTRYSYDKDTDEFLLVQKLYYLFDELGSVTALTDESGMPVKYYFYDPYGEVINTTNDPGNNFTFIGRYGGWKDWSTGFVQFWHRWYDSEVGKWTTRDPIGVRGGVNLYEYTSNNPVNGVDPLGLCSEPKAFPLPSLPATCHTKYVNCVGDAVGNFLLPEGSAICAISAAAGCAIVNVPVGESMFVQCFTSAFNLCVRSIRVPKAALDIELLAYKMVSCEIKYKIQCDD